MKIKLLNDGGFSGLSGISFPIEVPSESVDVSSRWACVDSSFMRSVGAVFSMSDIGDGSFYIFTPEEYEVVE